MRFMIRAARRRAGEPGGLRPWPARRPGVPAALHGETGQGMLEYAIIGGIIIVGAVAVLSTLSSSLNHLFTTISTTLSQY